MQQYIPAGINERISSRFKQFCGEVRTVTVCFVSVGFDLDNVNKLDENSVSELQSIFTEIQKDVNRYSGDVNKFMFDDKGKKTKFYLFFHLLT